MNDADAAKSETTCSEYVENVGTKPNSENRMPVNRNKDTKSETQVRTGFKYRESRYPPSQRDEQIINEKLGKIKGPTTNLPPLKYADRKFPGRARLYIGNLPSRITEEEIKSLFSKYGDTDEIFINQTKGFGFIKMDCADNAERAKNELMQYNLQGRSLVIRHAHPAAIRVKNLPWTVSNELLHIGFAVFGEVEHAYVIVDDRGKPTGEGVVEYFRKPSALLALKSCTEGCYFLTSSLKPVIVENYEPPGDFTGCPEQMIKKSPEYYRDREIGPRFAARGSFQFDYAERWKTLYQNYKEKIEALKSEQHFEEQKLEAEMRSAQYDHETEQLKEMLRIREMDRKHFKQDWEIRQRELEERQKFSNESEARLRDNLLFQANQFNDSLVNEEAQLQQPWHLAGSSTSHYWANPGAERHSNHDYRPMNKRPRR